MKKLDEQDPATRSRDVVAENIEQLKALFPEMITEGAHGAAVNVDVLKDLVGDSTVADGEEKYGLTWHGKRRARRLALMPSTGTLRPCREHSIDWETTKNLMIEGDNLEVLKLLQKSYARKVKLIYIDPPYNTGKDFVYPDNYRDSIQNYLELTGQVQGGAKISSNTEASGRFHTDWLNMMYPRLKAAHSLLTHSGVVFISIDDGEVSNVRRLCDEVFGEENFVATFIWQKRTTRENRKAFSISHDYLVCYARSYSEFAAARNPLPFTDEVKARYSNPDNDPRGVWQSVSLNAQAGPGRRAEQFFSLITPGGRVVDPPAGRCWIVTEPRMEELIADGRVWFGEDGNNVPREKAFLSEARDGLTPHTVWTADEVGTNDSAKKELTKLFGGVAVFDTPKPVELLQRVVRIGMDDGDIALDFFAGSGPMAEAVVRCNAEDGGARRFLLIQLPEPINETLPQLAEIRGLGLSSIFDIGRSRMTRVLGQLRSAGDSEALDLGFRVFTLDSSNIRTWDPDPDDLNQTLLDSVEHIKEDRTQTDVLYEVLLKLGLDLCVPIETRTFAGKEVHSVGGGVLIACLSESIASDDVEDLARGIVTWHGDLNPAGDVTCIFRDSAFADDVAKTNLAAILEQRGIDTVRSL